MHHFVGLLLAASAVLPTGEPVPIAQRIITTSLAYGISPEMMLEVARCESNFNPKAVGDRGKAYGVYQFHYPTFLRFSKEAGVKLDYKNPDHAIELAAWAIRNGYASHWTCHKIVRDRFS